MSTADFWYATNDSSYFSDGFVNVAILEASRHYASPLKLPAILQATHLGII